MIEPPASLLTFPCQFPIKVFGAAIPELEVAVTRIIEKHIPHFDPINMDFRLSKGNRYQSITVTVTAISQQQLDAIYQDLSADELIIMTL